MKPQFLNWNKPLLHLAAEYFAKEFGKDGRLWMKNIVVVLPTSPAKERLEELLAIEAEKMPKHDWYPPRFITFGDLPEEFYTQEKIVADKMTQSFTWINVIENAEDHLQDILQVTLPEKDDIEARFRLGMMFAKLHYDLASEGKNCQDVANLCREIPSERQRWTALAELENRYLDELDDKGFWDIQAARQNAVAPRGELQEKVLKERQKYIEQFRENGKKIYLVGVTDMNKAQKEILEIFDNFVYPLVFAPEELKDRFDDLGCLRPEKWVDADIPIADSQIDVVLDDHEQADAVIWTIAKLAQLEDNACGDVIVGVPNTDLIPLLEDRFERAEIKTKYVKRKKIQKTGVYRLLEILPELLENPKDGLPYREFAELLRHPEIYFKVKAEDVAGELLTLLDKYHGQHLPETVSKDWRKDILIDKDDVYHQEKDAKSTEHLTDIFETVRKLLTLDKLDDEERYADRLNSIFEKLYKKENEEKQSQDIKRVLKIIREAMDKVDNVCAKILLGTSLGKMPFADYIRLVLLQLSDKFIAPYETMDAVDFVGWLDIPMDDAKIVIVTGMNDGTVPSYVVSDQFLPDHLRTKLNILNNEQRIARDAYNLSVILRTRPEKNVKLIASRTAAPSRLFFADKDEKVCERVKNFFKEKKDIKRQPEVYFQNEGKIGKRKNSAFEHPPKVEKSMTKPKTSMSVTEFKKYKQCPYRFYLGNILWLRHLDDSDNELAANSFGDLIHKALEEFGKDKTKRDSDDPETIFQTVEKKFTELASRQFGEGCTKPAVLFQIALAKQRLKNFSQEQAAWRNEGWQIIETEKSFRVEDRIKIDEMTLTGKIDRIDKRTKDGIIEYAVLDYKSSDTAKKPDDVHRQGTKDEKKWIDFQLPLYHYLLQKKGGYGGKMRLGYFTLPKDDKGGVKLAEWKMEDIDSAVKECEKIANEILKENFEFDEKADPPKYDDFPEICLTPQVKRKW